MERRRIEGDARAREEALTTRCRRLETQVGAGAQSPEETGHRNGEAAHAGNYHPKQGSQSALVGQLTLVALPMLRR